MITGVFAIRDTKTEQFLVPFYAPTCASAIRSFGDAVNDSQTQFSRHPEDYILFCLCAFDDEKGVFLQDAKFPDGSLMRGIDCVRETA